MRCEDRSPVRVCCLCESWASGGIESFLCNVLMRLDIGSLEVDVVVAQLDDSVFTDKLRSRGVRFYELSGNMRRVGDNHRRFRALLRERHYDVLHLNAYQGLSLAYLRIAKEAGVPVRIAHSHNTALRKSATRPIKLVIHSWARERYTKDATALWACSKDAAAFLFSAHELDKRGFQFIPNGIDTDRFRFDPAARETVRHELSLDGKYVIGNVGRLCYQKNQSFLLDVLAEAVKGRPESVLLLAGEGEDKPMLEEKARRLGLEDKVLFTGASKHIERLYWAMDVFVLSSRFEGLPVTAVEAQAAGLRCLLSDTITEECAILNSTEHLLLDTAVWAETITKAYERMTDGADAVREAGFDIAQAAEQISAFYKKTAPSGEKKHVDIGASEKGQAPAV